MYQRLRLNIGKRSEMIIFGSLLTTFEPSSIFLRKTGLRQNKKQVKLVHVDLCHTHSKSVWNDHSQKVFLFLLKKIVFFFFWFNKKRSNTVLDRERALSNINIEWSLRKKLRHLKGRWCQSYKLKKKFKISEKRTSLSL